MTIFLICCGALFSMLLVSGGLAKRPQSPRRSNLYLILMLVFVVAALVSLQLEV